MSDRGPFSCFVLLCQALIYPILNRLMTRPCIHTINRIDHAIRLDKRRGATHIARCIADGVCALEILFLLSVGLIAGAINSLAGGGSFIVFPALLLVGVPPVMANATNTFSALPGYLSGAIGFRRNIWAFKKWLPAYAIAALVGGYLGADLLLKVDDAQFSSIVPWLMAMAVFMFAFGGKINAWVAARAGGTGRMALAGTLGLLALLTLICLYGGFFNAGLGIILLAFFALAGMKDIHAMNGVKLLISVIVAAIAVWRFALSGSIAWYEGWLVFAGTMIGGYVSARLAHRIPKEVLRWAVIIYGLVLTVVFFWQAYA